MNFITLIGRMVKDPEIKTTQSQIAFCGFTIAVDRKYKGKDGERETDFIQCVAWKQQAEFIGKYFHKGSRICITGSLQTRSYDDKDGVKRYVSEVVVENAEFIDLKKDESDYKRDSSGVPSSSGKEIEKYFPPSADTGFYPAMDDDTNNLPFDL